MTLHLKLNGKVLFIRDVDFPEGTDEQVKRVSNENLRELGLTDYA